MVGTMLGTDLLDCGWCRDLPDHRDYTLKHPVVRRLIGKLTRHKSRRTQPAKVDWREYCTPVEDQLHLATGSAHACIGLIQYFERRSSGRLLRPSRLFLHVNARRLSGGATPRGGVG